MNCLLQGFPGSGKTFSALSFPEPVYLFLIENREAFYTEVIARYYPKRLITIVPCHIRMDPSKWFTPTNPVATYKKFKNEFEALDFSSVGTIIIDDVALLRKHGGEVWKKENNKKAVSVEKGWGEVNDRIRYMVIGAMNACTHFGKTCIITTTMRDNYVMKNGESFKDGFIPDVISDIPTNIDFQIGIENNNGKYYAKIVKGTFGSMTLDITNKSLYNMLEERRRLFK